MLPDESENFSLKSMHCSTLRSLVAVQGFEPRRSGYEPDALTN